MPAWKQIVLRVRQMEGFMIAKLPCVCDWPQAWTAAGTTQAERIARSGVFGRELERRRACGIVRGMFSATDILNAPSAPTKPRVAPHKPHVQPRTAPPALEPPWHVILLDDDVHTHEYVIEMLGAIFGHSPELALKMANEVNASGRVIVATVHKELAELRQQQIEEYGPDRSVPECKVSMRAIIECAE